ncbi:MFS transporter [Erythrobacter sp. THAF29]|uniref:MFS transporter n=1 Tax=Erythrobacter sp. THAF29 TaxID=2587851 RepID=UPI0012684B85|nr:MFS transporter [Erythrobacter sp. THAF29]QFT78858.1 Major Facilitator Superfamily protein [Erythrobacter sp. THAF29]
MWFLVVFALAAGGGAVAYVPLLTVLLPLKITALLGSEDVASLARVTFYGAIVASLANIAFGMISDRSGVRLPWVVAGLISSSILLVMIGEARSLTMLIVLIMAWQTCQNMMLGPLLAWAGDCVPDSQKGTLGGLLAMAPALGALAGSLVTFEALVPEQYRLVTVALLVAVLVLPAIVIGRGRSIPELKKPVGRAEAGTLDHRRSRSAVSRMWLARFLVQISEAGLFAFLLFWLRSISEGFHENTAANIFSAVLVVSIPLSLIIGRWSDAHGRPIRPLAACAAIAGIGLVAMSISTELPTAIAGYVVFGIAASIFLSLHTSQTLRVLPQPQHRGRDLGIFNLTNTIPSIVMPWITLALVPGFGFSGLFILFACLAVVAALLLATLPRHA